MSVTPHKNGCLPPHSSVQIFARQEDMNLWATLLIQLKEGNTLHAGKESPLAASLARVVWNSTRKKMLACTKEDTSQNQPTNKLIQYDS